MSRVRQLILVWPPPPPRKKGIYTGCIFMHHLQIRWVKTEGQETNQSVSRGCSSPVGKLTPPPDSNTGPWGSVGQGPRATETD